MGHTQSSRQPEVKPKAARGKPRSSRQRALLAASVLADKKALRLVILDLRKLTVIADYFVICHGTSEVHVRALAEQLDEQVRAFGIKPISAQGLSGGHWVLLDLGDVIVHIFGEFERGFYDLEHLWEGAPTTEVS